MIVGQWIYSRIPNVCTIRQRTDNIPKNVTQLLVMFLWEEKRKDKSKIGFRAVCDNEVTNEKILCPIHFDLAFARKNKSN